MLFTDASDDGYGGYLVRRGGQDVVSGKFGEFEINKSSTFRELAAVKFALCSLQSVIASESISIFTDNFSASRILSVGISKNHLQKLAIDIFKICLQRNIRLIPQ